MGETPASEVDGTRPVACGTVFVVPTVGAPEPGVAAFGAAAPVSSIRDLQLWVFFVAGSRRRVGGLALRIRSEAA
ncbi:MAG: hypothetical protein AAFZ87_02895, partial [Planctomycetota bacterium]